MAYINVADWTPDQVTDWLKGLDESMYKYVYHFTNNEVGGKQLLNIRPYELEQLGMYSIGHQEIVLEAVEQLRNFHYNLDKENLQFLALHVATAARSLHRLLAGVHDDASKLETQILHDISRTISTIKPLISWLDRAPFQGQLQFTEIRKNMLSLGLVMATMGQRDRFAERPVELIRNKAKVLEKLANYIIQDITDPMLLQPASLNLVTVKKRDNLLDFVFETSYDGKHRVTDIKFNSPAHSSGKMEYGDEIVQINYQTVVGWQNKNVLLQLDESVPDVLLTLKKRPKHTKIYGQIYMQPYRLPSKKRSMGSRWGENLPSPRAAFLPVPEATPFNMPLSLKASEKDAATAASDTDDSSCSDVLTPTDTKQAEKERRLYYPKPRAMLQRRNTICGDKLLGLKSVSGVQLWHDRKQGVVGDPSSPSLRDKSISFGFGLEIAPRPTTCIGIASGGGNGSGSASGSGMFGDTVHKKLRQVPGSSMADGSALTAEEKSKPGVSKVVRFDANMKFEDYPVDEKYTCNVENTILETFEPIPFADEEEEDVLSNLRNTSKKGQDALQESDKEARQESSEEVGDGEGNCSTAPLVEAVNMPLLARRGRLDKSHSTPAYDNSGEESDTPPPAIEPRKEFLLLTPPVPPPRPRKPKDSVETPPPPPPKPPGLMGQATQSTPPPLPPPHLHPHSHAHPHGYSPAPVATSTPTEASCSTLEIEMQKTAADCKALLPVLALGAAAEGNVDANELHTPTKSRNLTLKKKHSLIAKRRNVNLKILGTGEIQGHLYRRTKDRRGVTFWARFYFVMLDTILYGFRSKDAAKASCVIFLPGFTVSLAKEVYSKPHAFKVYHSAKTFYFATESQDALNQWVEFIRNATVQPKLGGSMLYGLDSSGGVEVNSKDLFSETDSSGEENELLVAKNLCTPSPQGGGGSGTGKDNSSNAAGNSTPTSGAVKQDRRYLGSLRKLTKGSLPFKSTSSNEKKLPVPTEQYRSYRKVPGGSYGIQIGTNLPGYHEGSLAAYNKTPAASAACGGGVETIALVQRKLSLSSSRSSIISSGEPSSLGPPSSPAPTPTPAATLTASVAPATSLSLSHASISTTTVVENHRLDSDGFIDDSPTKSFKKIAYNFIHASNPNLVEFDFQTSKTLDYSLPKINPANSWDVHQNTLGFITLKELMLQKQEEEAQEMYNNRVLLGVEKKDEHRRGNARRGVKVGAEAPHAEGQLQAQQGVGRQLSKTQSRSLPKTPDYEISFKPDDEDIKKTRTKEGLKLRDFGYELISGDEPLGSSGTLSSDHHRHHHQHVHSQHQHHYQQQQQQLSHSEHSGGWTASIKARPFLIGHKSKKHTSSTSSADFAGLSGGDKRAGSLKKKGKFEALKTSSEHLFQFSSRQSAGSGGSSGAMTLTLPLHKKSQHVYDGGSGGSGSGIKKSHTYNHDLKEKAGAAKYEVQRKNSAPMPLFSKLSFGSSSSSGTAASSHAGYVSGGSNNSKVPKEKRILGSPLLRRTIFGSGGGGGGGGGVTSGSGNRSPAPITCTGREYDCEIFSQVIFPKVSSGHHHSEHGGSGSGSKFRTMTSTNAPITAPDVVAPPPPSLPPFERDAVGKAAASPTSSAVATPDYPNMECPPVFQAETYSLTEPNASMTLLLRRNNNNTNTINNTSGSGAEATSSTTAATALDENE